MKAYEVIVEDIKSKIVNGILTAGDKLPSIKEMMKIYNVSSITVRGSLTILSNEGYIETRERSGCYVKESKNDAFYMYFNEITNVKETILNTKILGISHIYDFNALGAQNLNEREGNKINTIKIRRTFNSYLDAPVVYDIKYVMHHFAGDVKQLSYYDNLKRIDYFLEKEIDKKLEIRIVEPSTEVCDILKVQRTTPVFYFKQKYLNRQGSLIALGQTYTIADSMSVTASSKKDI